MKSSSVLGLASAIVKGKKYRLILAGVQFAYLGYKYFKRNKRKRVIADHKGHNK